MDTRRRQNQYSFADYVTHERSSNVKHEFLDGEIYAMAGGSPEHAALSMAMGAELTVALRGSGCRVFSSDLSIRVQATGLATYPDASVVCGELERDPEAPDIVTNPTLVVEVLSPSTERYDRGVKLTHYKQIPSLRCVLLVAQDTRRVEVHRRSDDDTWTVEEAGAGDVVELLDGRCQIDLDAVYDDALGAP